MGRCGFCADCNTILQYEARVVRYIEKSYIMKITDEKSKPWVTLGSEYLVRRPWLTARRDCVRLANGVVNDEYYVLEYPDWVNVGSVDF